MSLALWGLESRAWGLAGMVGLEFNCLESGVYSFSSLGVYRLRLYVFESRVQGYWKPGTWGVEDLGLRLWGIEALSF